MKQKSRQLSFYEKNRQRILPLRREYARLHKEEKSEYDKRYRLLKGVRQLTPEQKEERRKYAIEYRKNHRSKLAQYRRERLKTDIQYRLSNILRSRLNKIVKGKQKSGSAVKDLGCTIPELKQYLENQFSVGMSWEKLGQIHIDHKIPLSRFDLTDKEQLLKAVHYTNLKPLWALDNYKKGNKLIYA